MTIINWTTGSGLEINVEVGTVDLDSTIVVKIKATVNGQPHNVGRIIPVSNQPGIVGRIGNIGLTRENRDKIQDAIDEATKTARSANRRSQASKPLSTQRIERLMRCGE